MSRIQNTKMKWDILESDELMECTRCGHSSKEWAEHEDRVEPDNTAVVHCPKCKSPNYYLLENDFEKWFNSK